MEDRRACVPESGVLGHRFVVSNRRVLPVAVTGSGLKRLKHDEFSHDIDRGVSAGRVSGRGRRVAIEEALSGYLPEVDADPAAACPARLAMAMRYSVLGGGKRLRPVLCLMAAEACGGDSRGGVAGGLCARDGAHLFADPRRSAGDGRRRPAAWSADLPPGVRRGDGDPGRRRSLDAGVRGRGARGQAACRRRCGACGSWPRRPAHRAWWPARWPTFRPKGEPRSQSQGRHGGAVVETAATLAALESIHRRKTGALLRAPLRMGAVIAAAPETCIEALDRYGKAVGLAFQIVDDLLDVQGDETKLGKRVGKDSELGKWTYPRFLGVDGSRRRARQLADEAVAALEPLGPRGDRLRDLALALLERDR